MRTAGRLARVYVLEMIGEHVETRPAEESL